MSGKCVKDNPKCTYYKDGECTVDFGDYPDDEYFEKGGVLFFCNKNKKEE